MMSWIKNSKKDTSDPGRVIEYPLASGAV